MTTRMRGMLQDEATMKKN